MQAFEMIRCLECNPVIAAEQDDKWDAAITSPAQVIFTCLRIFCQFSKRQSRRMTQESC